MSSKRLSEIIEELKGLPPHLRPTNIHRQHVDSAAEFNVYWSLQKISACEIIPQYQVGNYRVDFLLRRPEGQIGIEIDGKKWHSTKKDSDRDRFILKSSDVSDIIRFTGTDATFSPTFCVQFLYNNYNFLFVDPNTDWIKRSERYLSYKLRHEGVINISTSHIDKKHGYRCHDYDIEFIMPGDHEDYFNHNDGQPGYLRKPITYYTKNRSTKIKVMGNE